MPTEIVNYEYIGPFVKQRKYTNTTDDVVYTADYNDLGMLVSAYTYKDVADPDPDVDIVKFNYSFEPYSRNIDVMTYDHRTNDPAVEFTYDDLDRLTDVDYGMDSTDESFTIDDLGNRTGSQDLRSSTESYTKSDTTNRYTAIAGNSLTYDSAGNLTIDKDGCHVLEEYTVAD